MNYPSCISLSLIFFFESFWSQWTVCYKILPPIDIKHCNWKIALLHFNGPERSNGYIRYFYRLRLGWLSSPGLFVHFTGGKPSQACLCKNCSDLTLFKSVLTPESQIEADTGWMAPLGAPLWISSENINSIYLWGTIFNSKSHRIDVTCRSMIVNLWISPRFIGVTHGWARPWCSLCDIYFRYFMKIIPYFIMTFIGSSVSLLMARMMWLSLNVLPDRGKTNKKYLWTFKP